MKSQSSSELVSWGAGGVLRARRRGAVTVIRAMCESDHVLHAIESSRPTPCKFCADTTWRARVVEDSRAHRYRGGSGEQEFQGVSTGSDTSHSDDRDGGKRVMHLPDAAHSDRSDSRPGEPTGCSRQRRAHGGRVDYQAEQRVDQGQARGPGTNNRVGDFDNVRHVGRQLRKNRDPRIGASTDRLHHLSSRLRSTRKDLAAIGNIGAGDVDFDGVEPTGAA